MDTYTPEELDKIAMQIARQPGLYVPLPQGTAPVRRTPGPAVCVYLKYSEIVMGAENIQDLYWNALRQTPVIAAVGVLATIDCLLSEHRSADPGIHKMLQEQFSDTRPCRERGGEGGRRTRLYRCVHSDRLPATDAAFAPVRRPLGQGGRTERQRPRRTDAARERVFSVRPGAESGAAGDTRPSVVVPPGLGYSQSARSGTTRSAGCSRFFDILPGNDPEVRKLAGKLGINTTGIRVGSLPLNDFVAAVFGLFAYGRSLKGAELAIFDVRRVFAKVGFSVGVLRKLVTDRALTTSALRKCLSAGKPHTRKNFDEELERRSFLTDSLNIFRQNPLMKMGANRVLILDLEFLAELLTAGVYWNIFDGLPRNQRETFRELWGRLFELYAVDLLKQFYPPFSRILTADLTYDAGQVDGLLDFGQVVVVFEIKSSLLTETAKRSGNKADFVADYERKFVRNARGKPKALDAAGRLVQGNRRTAGSPWQRRGRPDSRSASATSRQSSVCFFTGLFERNIPKPGDSGTSSNPACDYDVGKRTGREHCPYVAEKCV